MKYDLRRLAAWGIGLTWGAWVLEFLNVVHGWRLVAFINHIDAGGDFNMAAAERLDNFGLLIVTPLIVCLVAAYIVNGIWIYRAAFNAEVLAPNPERIRPGWAIGWFFIPLLSFWMPYRAMRHTWNTAQNRETHINAEMPSWFHIWWGTWILINIIDQASMRAWNSLDSGNEGFAATLDLASWVIGAITTFYFVRILRQTTDGLHDQAEVLK